MSQRHDFRSTLRNQPKPSPIPRDRFLHEYPRETSSEKDIQSQSPYPSESHEKPDATPIFTSETSLFEWHVHETETRKPSRKLLFWFGSFIFGIVGYALFFINSPISAITFILVGFTGYLLLHKEPRFLQCRVLPQGIAVNRELFSFESMDSFWIFEDGNIPPFVRLKTKILIEPFVDIPLGETDPEDLRETLSRFLPEEPSDLTLVDILSRMLHI